MNMIDRTPEYQRNLTFIVDNTIENKYKDLLRKFSSDVRVIGEQNEYKDFSDVFQRTVAKSRQFKPKRLQFFIFIGNIEETFPEGKDAALIFDKFWEQKCILYIIDSVKKRSEQQKILYSLFTQRTGGFYQHFWEGSEKQLSKKVQSCTDDSMRIDNQVYPHMVDFILCKLPRKKELSTKAVKEIFLKRLEHVATEHDSQLVTHPTDDCGFQSTLEKLVWNGGCFESYNCAERFVETKTACYDDIAKNISSPLSVLERTLSVVFESPATHNTILNDEETVINPEITPEELADRCSMVSIAAESDETENLGLGRDFLLVNLPFDDCQSSESENSPVEHEDPTQISVKVFFENNEVFFRSLTL